MSVLTERVNLVLGFSNLITVLNLGYKHRLLAINRVRQQICYAGYLCFITAQQGTCCPSCAEGGMHITPAIWQWSWRQLSCFLSYTSLLRLVPTFTPTTSGRWSLIKVMHSVLCTHGTNVSVSGGYLPRLLPPNPPPPPPPEIHCSFPNGAANNTWPHFIRLHYVPPSSLSCNFVTKIRHFGWIWKHWGLKGLMLNAKIPQSVILHLSGHTLEASGPGVWNVTGWK